MTNRSRALLEAARLTRAGRWAEATAVIQGSLQGRDMSDHRPGSADREEPGVRARIDKALRTTPWARALDDWQNRDPLRGTPGSAEPTVADGARFEDRSFTIASGSRRGSLYVPAAPMPNPALIVMLHGCTQTPEDFAVGTRMNDHAERHGFLVLYPRQSRAANAQHCWNWFQPNDQERDRGEPGIIAGMTDRIASEFGVDRRRIFAAGLSAGGSEAAILGAVYPDIFQAIGVHSGLAWRSAHDVVSAFAAMRQVPDAHVELPATSGRRPRLIVFHGDRDATVHPRNAEQVFAQGVGKEGLLCETRQEGSAYTATVCLDGSNRAIAEQWTVHGSGHAWSGGDAAGSHTDPTGPDASAEMVRFFLA